LIKKPNLQYREKEFIMQKGKIFFLTLFSLILFVGCEKNPAEPSPVSTNLFYKIEHVEGEYPYPVMSTGIVTTDSGYKYELLTGSSIYIKNNTELDFWFDYQIKNSTWTLEQVGRGGAIVYDTNTLKSNYNEIGSYTLVIEKDDGIFRVRIEVY